LLAELFLIVFDGFLVGSFSSNHLKCTVCCLSFAFDISLCWSC